MKHNGLYEKARAMMDARGFTEDPIIRAEALKKFRKAIKDAEMPTWMLGPLTDVQNTFLPGQGIRCRSSTNNEDLPGFNGAGLYNSFTHHPDEGHLSKSVKQVFASLWRFLAFEHRDFYRVDHFEAAMGVLLHPNYEGELSNGVAVSTHTFADIREGFHSMPTFKSERTSLPILTLARGRKNYYSPPGAQIRPV